MTIINIKYSIFVLFIIAAITTGALTPLAATSHIGFADRAKVFVLEKPSPDSATIAEIREGDVVRIIEICNERKILFNRSYTFQQNGKRTVIPAGTEAEIDIDNGNSTDSTYIQYKKIKIDYQQFLNSIPDDELFLHKNSDTGFQLYRYIKIRTSANISGWVRGYTIDYSLNNILYTGQRYLETGNYTRAVEKFDRALCLSEDSFTALKNRGRAYYKQGQYCRAAADFTSALILNPEEKELLRLRAEAYIACMKYEEALEDINSLIKKDPRNPAAYNLRGLIHMLKGQYAEAAEDLNRALTRWPGYSEALLNLSMTYSLQDRQEEACINLEKAVSSGLRHTEWEEIINNPFFENIRDLTCYKNLLDIEPVNNSIKSLYIIQNNKKIQIQDMDTVTLEKKPFVISFVINTNSGITGKPPSARIAASSHDSIFRFKPDTRASALPFFAWGTARRPERGSRYNTLLLGDNFHHYIFYYSDSNKRATIIDRIDDDYIETGWKINSVNYSPVKKISEENIYLVVFIDNSGDNILNEGEYTRFEIKFTE